MAKYNIRKAESLEKIIERYITNPNPNDKGAMGKAYDSLGRYAFTQKLEYCHHAGMYDCLVKSGVVIEWKNGCGSLDGFGYDTKEEAELAMIERRYLPNCTHIAYIPKFNGENMDETIITPRLRFIKILEQFKLVRVRRETDGKWRVAIQSYIPSPTFKASPERMAAFIEALEENGLYIDLFAEKFDIDLVEI